MSPGATLLSPFDNLLWDRPFAERLFGFKHVMEIYKPAPQRVYGYYVLPVLRGDRIVGRADLKSDRKAGVLRLLAFHREPRVRDSAALRESLDRALERLARAAGLDGVDRGAVLEESCARASTSAVRHGGGDPAGGRASLRRRGLVSGRQRADRVRPHHRSVEPRLHGARRRHEADSPAVLQAGRRRALPRPRARLVA